MISKDNIPKDWKLIELKDICSRKAEYGSGAKAIDYEDNKPRYIRITDIDDNGNLKNENKVCPSEIEEKYFLEEGDLLFARSGSVGKTYLYKKSDGICQYAGYLIRFKPKNEIINCNYLNYVTKSPYYWNWVESKKKTMTISNINAKQYSGLKIILPPLETQKKIVEILEKAEKLKEWRAEADELTGKFFESVFFNLFKDSGKLCSLKEISEVITKGTTPTTHGFDYVKQGIPFLRAENILGGKVELEQLDKFISPEANDALKRSKTKSGDVLLTIAGAIGRSGFISSDSPQCNLNQAISIIRLKKGYSPKYISYALNSPFIQKQIAPLIKKVAQANLNLQQVGSLKVPIDKEKEKEFLKFLERVETLKTHQKQSKQQINKLFNALMQKAFKGELTC